MLNFGHNNSSGAGAPSVGVAVAFSEVVVETVRNVSLGPGPPHDGKGLLMKKVTMAAVAALAFSASSAFAADMPRSP